MRREAIERLDSVAGEQEAHRPGADLAPELLQDQRLQIRLVVDEQDARAHPADPTRAWISLRSRAKSIGLASSPAAPPASALRSVSGSP